MAQKDAANLLLLTHAIVEAAKALGGSFKLVMPAPKTKRDDSNAQVNTKGWGHNNVQRNANLG